MAARMRAIVQRSFGGPEALQPGEVDRPVPRPGEVFVRVRAAGVNPIDGAARAGQLSTPPPPPAPWTIGRDLSGVIEQVAGGRTEFRPGDEVYGMLDDRQGAYAEYVAAPARYLARKPAGLSHLPAAGLPLAGLTAWQMLTEAARLQPGQRVLIHAAGGGVGHLAAQLKALGAQVLATARADNHDLLRSLGSRSRSTTPPPPTSPPPPVRWMWWSTWSVGPTSGARPRCWPAAGC
jgi:NADPH:quinone reductase-like Zn-dependent oxidoreductase